MGNLIAGVGYKFCRFRACPSIRFLQWKSCISRIYCKDNQFSIHKQEKGGGKLTLGLALLRNKRVRDRSHLTGGSGGGGVEFAQAGGAGGEAAQAAVVGGSAVIDLGVHDGALIVYGDDDSHLAGADATVGGDGEMGGLAAVKLPRQDGGTAVGLLLGLRFGGRRLHGILNKVFRIFDAAVLAVLEVLRKSFGVAVKLVGVGVAVVLELGAVHRDVAHRLCTGGGDEVLQLLHGVAMQFFVGLFLFFFLLLGEVQHEGVLPLGGISDPEQQQNDDHREMYDRGDQDACFLVGSQFHLRRRLRFSSASSTVVVRTSIATLLWPPWGTMMSA